MKQVTFGLDDYSHEVIKEYANKTERSISSVLRIFIKKNLNQLELALKEV